MIYLYDLFDFCFKNGKVPSIWTKAVIAPIHKSGKDPYEPLNYRGISLLSCVGKLYTSVLEKRIVNYCETLNLISDEQNGFRRDRSCCDHIFSLTSIIRNRLACGEDTYIALVDMEKAFDWIYRPLLLYRLLENNIDGKIYKAIKSLYTNTEAYVHINAEVDTDWFSVPSGVRQGDPLSPTLFSIFINSLVENLKLLDIGIDIGLSKVCILLYADDIVLIAKSEGELQTMLDTMEHWCKYWQLKVNNAKTNIMHLRGKRKKPTDFTFKFDGTNLQIVEQYKYLGFWLNEHLNYDVSAERLSEAGSRALGAIVSKFKLFKNVSYGTFTKLYNASVVPVIDYASGVWGFSKANCCDKIQNRALRYFLGVHKFCPVPAMHGDMGYHECKFRRFLNMLRYWNRIINR